MKKILLLAIPTDRSAERLLRPLKVYIIFNLQGFCGICRKQCHYEFNYGILHIMYRILCKTEGSRPY